MSFFLELADDGHVHTFRLYKLIADHFFLCIRLKISLHLISLLALTLGILVFTCILKIHVTNILSLKTSILLCLHIIILTFKEIIFIFISFWMSSFLTRSLTYLTWWPNILRKVVHIKHIGLLDSICPKCTSWLNPDPFFLWTSLRLKLTLLCIHHNLLSLH